MKELKDRLSKVTPPYLDNLIKNGVIEVKNTVNMTASTYDIFTGEGFPSTVENVVTKITLFNEFIIKGEFPEFNISGAVADIISDRLRGNKNESKDKRLELVISEIANGIEPTIKLEITKI